jgi:hypothetical protein
MYDHMYSGISTQFFIFMCLATFIGGIAALIVYLIRNEPRPYVRASAMIVLVVISFLAFMNQNLFAGSILNLIPMLTGILWFPAVIILAGIVVPGVAKARELPIWILVVSVLVYMTEMYFGAYIEGMVGLRSMNFLILIPPPSLPLAWMRIPEIFRLVIQSVVTFLLACLFFRLGVMLDPYVNGKRDPAPEK